MAMPIVTCEIVRELLNYDPDTGIFTWRHRDRKYCASDKAQKIWNKRYAGKKAGALKKEGYIKIKIFHGAFSAHRLAYLYMTGSLPSMDVDHIDRNKSNNRFENLREVSKFVNQQNRFNPRSDSRTQIIGAQKSGGKNSKKFFAKIRANGKIHHLGTFDTAEEAAAAYLAAKAALHPEAVFTLDTA
jgi:hypothetical protein